MEPAPKPTPRLPRPPTPTGKERRRGNRHRLNIPATIAPEPPVGSSTKKTDSVPIPVTVTHFSVNGLAFRTDTAVVVGSVYIVECFDSLLPPNLRVRVVTRRDLPAGGFEVGSEVV